MAVPKRKTSKQEEIKEEQTGNCSFLAWLLVLSAENLRCLTEYVRLAVLIKAKK